MGLLQKLKSALGFDGSESTASAGPRGNGDVDVTVEREPSTESEDAVKGTETASTVSPSASTAVEDETDGANAKAATDETEPAAEETEADAVADAEESEPEAAAEPEVDEGSTDPVTEIKGIGPAYAERLSSVGVETVGQLAVADAAEIAAETDLSESRVAGWIERATDY